MPASLNHYHIWFIFFNDRLVNFFSFYKSEWKIKYLILWVSELFLFNAKSAIFQLYGENILRFKEIISSLKQQSAGRHAAPLRNIILNLSQPIFINTEKQQIPIL
jgi:hypothetical protein